MQTSGWRQKLVATAAVVLTLIVFQTAVPNLAQAAYSPLYDWTNSWKITFQDPSPDGNFRPYEANQNITYLYYGYSNNVNYFKMVLGGNYYTTDAGEKTWGIYINSKPGGGTDGGLADIDYRLVLGKYNPYYIVEFQKYNGPDGSWFDGHSPNNSGTPSRWIFANRTTGEFDYYIDPAYNYIEWKISNGALGLPSTGSQVPNLIFGGLVYTSYSTQTWVDSAGPVVTPIPGGAILLGSGIVALIGLKRRKARKV